MINDMRALGESHLAYVLFIMPNSGEYRYHVHVVKNRMGGPSKHEFASFTQAVEFIKAMDDKLEGK